jgi:hypothetical protein
MFVKKLLIVVVALHPVLRHDTVAIRLDIHEVVQEGFQLLHAIVHCVKLTVQHFNTLWLFLFLLISVSTDQLFIQFQQNEA